MLRDEFSIIKVVDLHCLADLSKRLSGNSASLLATLLQPIRERRAEYEKNIPQVYEILKKGSEEARRVAGQTLAEVRKAMKIDYFDDAELIAEHTKKYQK